MTGSIPDPFFWPTAGEKKRLAALVDEVVATDARIAALQAQRTEQLAALSTLADEQTARIPSSESRARELPRRSIAMELGAATRTSDRSVQRAMDQAVQLTAFPAALAALREGRISRSHLLAIVDVGLSLEDPEKRAEFEEIAVGQAERKTAGELRASLALIADRMQPRTMTERHHEAREKRFVHVTDLSDGMAELYALLPGVVAHGIADRLTRQARAVKNANARAAKQVRAEAKAEKAAARAAAKAASSDLPGPDGSASSATSPSSGSLPTGSAPAGSPTASDGGEREMTRIQIIASDPRTMDQIRADLLADMLLTSMPGADPTEAEREDGPGILGAIRAHVQVVVPVLTAAGLDEGAVDLTGHSPVDAETARRLIANGSGFDRVLTHPISGAVLAVDRYERNAAMKRFLDARDQHCRTMGCRTPAHRCDHDHTLQYSRGGATDVTNLANFCKRHHPVKDNMPWKVRQLGGGKLEWTSPIGRVYIDEPPTFVGFVPDGDPAPF